eukprot:3553013-Rhodomonas_salina.1
MTQKSLNRAYLGPEFEVGSRYGTFLNVIFTCMMFSSGMPILLLVASLFSFVTCWVAPPFSADAFFDAMCLVLTWVGPLPGRQGFPPPDRLHPADALEQGQTAALSTRTAAGVCRSQHRESRAGKLHTHCVCLCRFRRDGLDFLHLLAAHTRRWARGGLDTAHIFTRC